MLLLGYALWAYAIQRALLTLVPVYTGPAGLDCPSDRTFFPQLLQPGQPSFKPRTHAVPCRAGEQGIPESRAEQSRARRRAGECGCLLCFRRACPRNRLDSPPNPIAMAAPPSPSSPTSSGEVAVHRFGGTMDASSSPSRYVRDVNPSLMVFLPLK